MALTLLAATLLLALPAANAEPIRPIPLAIDYDPGKAALGKELFHDPLLSLDQTVSCASCHDLAGGGHDPRPVSTGIMGRQGTMAAPTVFNAVFNFRQFWNGRAADLKEQAAGPLQDPREMGMSPDEVERRLSAVEDYRRTFRELYGGNRVRFDDVLDALAEFQRALVTPNSPFDRYLRGETPLPPQGPAGLPHLQGDRLRYLPQRHQPGRQLLPEDRGDQSHRIPGRGGRPFQRNRQPRRPPSFQGADPA
ncbi:cytochrome-c peroxidase [Desulfurivibrio sp. D14AmB]|uniref:cytochrome-c peroxidase n=1 Tax=Desulfurivibrio sp. D14AmB TaxID=3374370 RepID=UPI00376F102F